MQALDLKAIDGSTGMRCFKDHEYGIWEEYAGNILDGFGSNKANITAMVQDALSLLTVSERNLESVKNQAWYGRIWKTMTGKNKALAQENQTNLLKVQKIAIYMMNLAVSRDMILAEAVKDIHNKITRMRYDLAVFQGTVVETFRKLTDRLYHVEGGLGFSQIIDLIDKGYYDEYPREYDVLKIMDDVLETRTQLDDKTSLTLKMFLYNHSKQLPGTYAVELKERLGAAKDEYKALKKSDTH